MNTLTICIKFTKFDFRQIRQQTVSILSSEDNKCTVHWQIVKNDDDTSVWDHYCIDLRHFITDSKLQWGNLAAHQSQIKRGRPREKKGFFQYVLCILYILPRGLIALLKKMGSVKTLPKAQRTQGIESLNLIEFFKLINENQNLGQTSSWSCLVNNLIKPTKQL